jgi:RimJ/RimL family protein N-acetyltransferase
VVLLALQEPEPRLRSDRVELRPIERGDAESIFAASTDSLIQRHTFLQASPTQADRKLWVEQKLAPWTAQVARFAIADRRTAEFLGSVSVYLPLQEHRAECGFWVVPSGRRQYAARDALGLVARWAFDVLGVERLSLLIEEDNIASNGVAEACGFTREGVLRSYQLIRGVRADVVSWSLLPADPPRR